MNIPATQNHNSTAFLEPIKQGNYYTNSAYSSKDSLSSDQHSNSILSNIVKSPSINIEDINLNNGVQI